MDNVAKEFDSKLNKVHEHYKTMQKNYEKEMNKIAIMMAELEKKLSEKKSESLVTGDIVDKLAPHGIYGTKDNGHKSLELEKNYTEAVASGGLTRSVSADSGLAKPGPTSSVTQTRTGKSNSTSGANGGLRQSGPFSSHIEGPPPPEMATFDGRSEWCPFKIQFDRIADRYKWSKDQRVERLIESLRDKAHSIAPVQNQSKITTVTYAKKFKSRFGQKELPLTARRKLQDIKQENKIVEEFAEQVQEMVTEGYPDAPESVTDTIASDTFLKGIKTSVQHYQ